MDNRYIIIIDDNPTIVCTTLDEALQAAADQVRHAPGSRVDLADVCAEDVMLTAEGEDYSYAEGEPAPALDWTSSSSYGREVYLAYSELCKPLDRGEVRWYGLNKLGAFLITNSKRKLVSIDAVLDEIKRQVNESGALDPDGTATATYELRAHETVSGHVELIEFDVEAISDGDEVTSLDIRF